jgi:hypothetical protein
MERYLRYQVIATKIGCTKGKDLLLGDIQCHSESYFVFSLFRNRTALTNACRHWYKTVFIKLCAPFTYVILSFRVRVPMLCAIIVEALNMHLKSNNWLAFLSNLTLVLMVLCQRPAPVSSRAHLLPTKKCSTHKSTIGPLYIYLSYPNCGVYSLFAFYDALDFCNMVRAVYFLFHMHPPPVVSLYNFFLTISFNILLVTTINLTFLEFGGLARAKSCRGEARGTS